MDNNYFNTLYNESVWTDDNLVTSCHNCRNKFSLFNRRHHCRLCGKIYCCQCSEYSIYTDLTGQLIKIDDFLNECLHKPIRFNNKKRTCYQCYKILTNINTISNYIKIIDLLKVDIYNIYKLLLVNNLWNKSVLYYLYKFKKLHYLTLYNNINNFNNIIDINQNYIRGHNKLITLHIILNSNNWTETEVISNLNKLQTKVTACKNLLCNNKCQGKLNKYNILFILYYTKNKYLKIQLLKLLKIDNIKLYLPILIKYIENDNINDYSITDFIINNCKTIDIYIELFLQLFIIINNNDLSIYKNAIQRIKDTIKNTDKLIYEYITNSIQFINKLCKININNVNDEICTINNFIKENILYLPFSVNKQIKFISSNIIIKDSKTNPIILEIYFIDNTKIDILLKNEDVRYDYIICKTIKFIETICNTNFITYEVIPINNNCGLIEIVPKSYTLYEIKEQYNLTLQNFIMEKNKKQTIEIIKNKFIDSLSIYSVITYILGIGDRHLDNIMITEDGILFHIDYSFCLGYDPKPFYPCIRITQDMIDMIGGIKSDGYNIFIKKSNNYYNIIRKYTNIISIYISLLNSIDTNIFNNDFIKNHIKKKFIYPESDMYAQNILNNTIINNTENYTYIDFIHYHSKEKTVSKTISNIYDQGLTLGLNLKKSLHYYIN